MNPDWLAGLIDGEGCFTIRQKAGRGSWTCELRIAMRADELPMLESIREYTGIGSIYSKPPGGNSNPGMQWCVGGLAPCLMIISLLDGRMRSRKKEDFNVWKRAVYRIRNDGPCAPELETLAAEIKEVRRYK